VIRAVPSSPSNNLHWFQSQSITPPDGLVNSLVKEIFYELWHQRFGHPSKNALRQAPPHVTGLPTVVLPETSTPCKDCALGKMHDRSYPPSGKQATHPLSLVHTDLVGPIPTESRSRACYVLQRRDLSVRRKKFHPLVLEPGFHLNNTDESLAEFRNCPHQDCSTMEERTLFCPPVEARQSS
jgi:hypothetical protein